MKNTEIMAEMLPAAKRDDSSGPIAILSVPSSLLEEGQDYTVALEKRSGGRMEQASTFTFHVSK